MFTTRLLPGRDGCARRWPAALLLLCAACASEDDDYFPTTPGYEWVYDVSRTALRSSEPIIQKSIVRNLRAERVGAQRYYPKIYASGEKRYFTRTSDGVAYRRAGAQRPALILSHPPAPGARWRAPSRLYLFELPGKPGQDRDQDQIKPALTLDYAIVGTDDVVDVPAGRFARCVRVEAQGFLDLPARAALGIRSIKVEQTQWFAPGVGLVKMTRREYAPPDLYPARYTQSLTAFSRR